MSTRITIDRKLNGGRHPVSISLTSSNEQPQDLSQTGPVVNDVIRYRGTYGSRREALRAALDYLKTGMIVEHRDPMAGGVMHTVRRIGYQPTEHAVVLAWRDTRGEWISA